MQIHRADLGGQRFCHGGQCRIEVTSQQRRSGRTGCLVRRDPDKFGIARELSDPVIHPLPAGRVEPGDEAVQPLTPGDARALRKDAAHIGRKSHLPRAGERRPAARRALEEPGLACLGFQPVPGVTGDQIAARGNRHQRWDGFKIHRHNCG